MAEQQVNTGQAQASDQTEIHACMDVMPPVKLQKEAKRLAIEENPANGSVTDDPLTGTKAFVLRSKIWKPGRTLRVRFLGGTPEVQEKVRQYANEWSNYTSLKFDFGDHADAQIRISFVKDGSWSYIGTDCLTIPDDEATMNYGWFDKPVSEDEYSRVIIHEFGHAIGMPHEHQHPEVDIPWNREAVYRYYMNPPNNWSQDQVDNNLFGTYDKSQTIHGDFDRHSIMLYPIPEEFVTDPKFAVSWSNTQLSEADIEFMRTVYP
jgi:serralysin